jgi:hypothetical protein
MIRYFCVRFDVMGGALSAQHLRTCASRGLGSVTSHVFARCVTGVLGAFRVGKAVEACASYSPTSHSHCFLVGHSPITITRQIVGECWHGRRGACGRQRESRFEVGGAQWTLVGRFVLDGGGLSLRGRGQRGQRAGGVGVRWVELATAPSPVPKSPAASTPAAATAPAQAASTPAPSQAASTGSTRTISLNMIEALECVPILCASLDSAVTCWQAIS